MSVAIRSINVVRFEDGNNREDSLSSLDVSHLLHLLAVDDGGCKSSKYIHSSKRVRRFIPLGDRMVTAA